MQLKNRFLKHLGIAVAGILSTVLLLVVIGLVNRAIRPLSPYGDVLLVLPLVFFIFTLFRHRLKPSALLLTYAIAVIGTAFLIGCFVALVALALGVALGTG